MVPPRRPTLLAAAVLLLGVTAPAARAEDEAGGPGQYRALLDEVVARWRPAVAAPDPSQSLRLTCLTTPGEEKYVGALQEAVIEAPLSAVAAVLDDVPHYRDLFPDTVDVHEVPGSRQGDRFVTAWEQKAPAFFLPNIRFELVYQVDRTDPARVDYRYWLLRPGTIRHSDGAVLLESLGPGRTRFTEFDFFDAAWGPVPLSMVWSEALKGMFLSDVALRLKAEHPARSYAEVADEAARRWRAEPGLADRCRAQARTARSLLDAWRSRP
jgi:hypothetical protein